ncbi:hypothetical protein SEA_BRUTONGASTER_171 [Gordonia phage BrutonGaster]|uniref:Uncharacterized protein n=1 Tax=Gordonia phage BrutonGaster TaxID=2530116 RepID=A0A482JHG9_9CAUD|nr:hypothetical protein HOV26_gp011 [Gordonia phage BrutonGaster]QBP33385.1 hypothetical protein SEA_BRUTONGASTER_171 [Gordonia phage BrutonGaster]
MTSTYRPRHYVHLVDKWAFTANLAEIYLGWDSADQNGVPFGDVAYSDNGRHRRPVVSLVKRVSLVKVA